MWLLLGQLGSLSYSTLDGVKTNQREFALPRSVYHHTVAVVGGTNQPSIIIDLVNLNCKSHEGTLLNGTLQTCCVYSMYTSKCTLNQCSIYVVLKVK